jgi:hypothetical protein
MHHPVTPHRSCARANPSHTAILRRACYPADTRHRALHGWRTASCPFSAKISAFLTQAFAPHRSYAVSSPAQLTVASARTWRWHSKLLCSNRRVVPLGCEISEPNYKYRVPVPLRTARISPRPSPGSHQSHWSLYVTVQSVTAGCTGGNSQNSGQARVSPHVVHTVSPNQPSLRTSTPLASSRHVPCPTQRTHVIELWVAVQHSIRASILSERSYKGSYKS